LVLYTLCQDSPLEEALEKVKEVASKANLSEFGAHLVPPNAWEGLMEIKEDSVEFGVGSKGFFNMEVEYGG